MNAKEKIEELLEASEDGTITAAQVTEAGLHRSILKEFVKSGEMYRFGRGLYVRSNAWEDDFYLLQRKYGRGIYSNDTALYLLGYSDRTPVKYTKHKRAIPVCPTVLLDIMILWNFFHKDQEIFFSVSSIIPDIRIPSLYMLMAAFSSRSIRFPHAHSYMRSLSCKSFLLFHNSCRLWNWDTNGQYGPVSSRRVPYPYQT